jgi:hypothetical protein
VLATLVAAVVLSVSGAGVGDPEELPVVEIGATATSGSTSSTSVLDGSTSVTDDNADRLGDDSPIPGTSTTTTVGYVPGGGEQGSESNGQGGGRRTVGGDIRVEDPGSSTSGQGGGR